MLSIRPCLWFHNEAEEAVNFYLSVFPHASIEQVIRSGHHGPGPAGTVISMSFQVNGQSMTALNGGAPDGFTPALSLFVSCETQDEVDELWEKLSQGGVKQPCGWLTDRYGVSWQIVPNRLGELLQDPDPEKAGRVLAAMLRMSKLDIALLQQAYDG